MTDSTSNAYHLTRAWTASLACAVLAFVAMFPAVAAAQITITTFDHNGDGIGNDNSGGDTYVSEELPGDNFGGDVEMSIRSPHSSNLQPRHKVPYARFDLSAVNDKSATTSASIQLYDLRFNDTTNRSLQGIQIRVYGLTDESQDGWDESDVSWNGVSPNVHAPGHQGDSTVDDWDFVGSETMLLGSFTFDGSADPTTGWSQEVPLNDLLALVQADSNDELTLMFTVTPAISPYLSNVNRFLGSEESVLAFRDGTSGTDDVPLGSLAPRLILDGVEFTSIAVPEPSALIAWIILGFSLATIHCRQWICPAFGRQQ